MLGYIICNKSEINVEKYKIQSFYILHIDVNEINKL